MTDKATDWLGYEYAVGDLVLYPAMSGRSCNMVLANVVKIGEKTVTVSPVQSARWKQHGGRTRYIDTRTGKGIDPFSHDKGVKRHPGYENAKTGEFLDWRATHLRFGSYQAAIAAGFERVPVQFHEWVQQVHPAQQVVLQVTQNITKFNRPIPAKDDPYES